MAAPDRAFNEVKSILRKLDRDIQSARDRRLGVDPLPDEQNAAMGRDMGAGLQPGENNPTADRNSIDQSRNNTPGRDANDGGRHGFGRARPKPRPSPGP